jgi:hypothetical protein
MSQMFDPTKHGGDSRGAGNLDRAGDYLMVCGKFKRESTNSNKPYLLCHIKVIAGPQEGRTMLQRIYLNDEALWKLGNMCKAVGHNEPFDLRSDKDVRAAICNRPFKAKVEIKQEGEKRYANIGFFYFDVSDAEGEQMDSWVADHAAGVDGGTHEDDPGLAAGRGSDDMPF